MIMKCFLFFLCIVLPWANTPPKVTTILSDFKADTADGTKILGPGVHLGEQDFDRLITKSLEIRREYQTCAKDLDIKSQGIDVCKRKLQDLKAVHVRLQKQIESLNKDLESRRKALIEREEGWKAIERTYKHDVSREKLKVRVERTKSWLFLVLGLVVGFTL